MQFIFDLIGYYSALTITMGSTILAFGILLLWVGDLWLYHVTDGEMRNALTNKLPSKCKWLYDTTLPFSYMFVIVGLFMLFAMNLLHRPDGVCPNGHEDHTHHKITIVAQYVWLSLKWSPFFSYITSVGTILIIVDYVAKKGYKLSKVVKSLEEKSK